MTKYRVKLMMSGKIIDVVEADNEHEAKEEARIKATFGGGFDYLDFELMQVEELNRFMTDEQIKDFAERYAQQEFEAVKQFLLITPDERSRVFDYLKENQGVKK